MRNTKIVCTIGPACEAAETLSQMMDAGMNVARLNLSHGDYEEHGKRVANLKRLRAAKGLPLAIMLDTKGPEVRIGAFEHGEPVDLQSGQLFTLTSRTVEGTREQVSMNYPALCIYARPGHRILIDDGLVGMKVLRVENGEDIICQVLEGGRISDHKSVSVPGVDLHIPSLTERDLKDILFGVAQGVDLVAASFVCRADDVTTLRRLLTDHGAGHVGIFAKIENRAGVYNR